MNNFTDLLFFLVPVIVFVAIAVIILNPKRGEKTMEKQFDRLNNMMDDMMPSLKKLSKKSIEMQKEILGENKEDLKDISNMQADIESESLTKKASAIKKGLSKDTIYCKYCGSSIDEDSVFCKNCGKRQ